MRERGRLRRRDGWRRFRYDAEVYNNHDLHDQLCGEPDGLDNLQEYYEERTPPYSPQESVTTYPPSADYCGTAKKTRSTGRQPVTLLYEALSSNGLRRLIAGTQNRLYVLNERKGNWKIIADAYGGDPKSGLPERRWKAATASDVVVFTNNFDPPLAWHFDQPTYGCAMQAVSEIEDLKTLGITKASVICSWHDVVFMADVEQNGIRLEQRVVWSDKGNGLSYVPGNSSIASFQDLMYGERVLAMIPLVDYLFILTNKSIWQVSVVGGAAVYRFQQVYLPDKSGDACIAFGGTAASDGAGVIYCGADGVYKYNLYMAKPERVDWIHAASNTVFETINNNVCNAHVANYNAATKEYWLSWVETGKTFATRTMSANMEYGFVDFIDHGFTALVNYKSDNRQDVTDWLLENCLCTVAELNAQSDLPLSLKEGGYCTEKSYPSCSGSNRYAPLYTNKSIDVGGVLVEDWNQPTSDAGSVCRQLGDLSIEDICQECNAKTLLVVASAVDWCLKQVGGVFYREECTSMLDCGTYAKVGYDSVMRPSPLDFGRAVEDKTIREVELGAESEDQTIPSTVQVRVGYSGTAVDPNAEAGRCAPIWRDLKPKQLKCMSDADVTEHIRKNTRPSRTLNWPTFYTGRYLYLEFKISGQGGASSFSHINMDVRQNPRSEKA